MSCTYTFNNKDYTKEDLITQLSVYNIDLVNQVTNIGLQNASKVIDENGEPLVVYHGTPNKGFTEFKKGMSFFSSSRVVAKTYEDKTNNSQKGVYSTFLNIRNIEIIDAKNSSFSSIEVTENTMLSKKSKLSVQGIYESVFGYRFPGIVTDKKGQNKTDGILVENVKDDLLGNGRAGVSDVYVTAKPNQIKSATEIKGTTTEETNDIRYLTKRPQYKNATKQFTGNYRYLTEDFISDFYIDQLKEKQKNSAKYKNFYSNFEVNEKGINLLNADDITMQQIEIYADNNLRQYSLISKQMPDLEVEEINENPRDLVVNNPQTLENYKKDLFRVNEDTIILKDNIETFIKVNDEIYENVEVKGNLSTFAKIKTENEAKDYYQYNIKPPKTDIRLSDYNYLSTQEDLFTSPKKYLKQEEKNQIKNDKFNC